MMGKQNSLRCTVSIDLEEDQIVDSLLQLDYEDLERIIVEVDLMVADVGFTEHLIRKLALSLKADAENVDLPFIDWEKVK
jgi:hypothetical protein